MLGSGAGPELRQRHLARDGYEDLLRLAGDWGAPDPIRNAMATWRFDDARAAMEVASAWLVERDALIAKVARAGLTTPDQLRQRFAAVGGGADAQAELAAEVRGGGRLPRGPGARRGHAGSARDDRALRRRRSAELLAQAGTDFAQGDLQAAAETLDAAEVQLNRAPTNGVVRIASAVVLLAVLVLLWSLTARRRGGSHYTAGG